MPQTISQNGRGVLTIPALTSVRYFAALAVMLYHVRGYIKDLPSAWMPLFYLGGASVSFFYMLSGLVLTLSYYDRIQRHRLPLRRFLGMRLARVYPMYLFALLLATYLFHSSSWRIDAEREWKATSWVIHLFAVQSFFPIPPVIWKWNGPGWSVSCELFFYAVFPFALPVMARLLHTPKRVLIAVVMLLGGQLLVAGALILAINRFFEAGHLGIYGNLSEALSMIVVATPPLRLCEFLAGIVLGLWLRQGFRLPWRSSPAARSIGLILCFALMYKLAALPWSAHRETLQALREYLAFVPVLFVTLWLLSSGPNWFAPLLNARWVILLGEASYSFYVLHSFSMPVMDKLFHIHPVTSPMLSVTIVLLSACSILSFKYVETPTRRWLMGWVKPEQEKETFPRFCNATQKNTSPA